MQESEILKAIQLKEELEKLRPLDKEQEARIMQKFRLDWNYHSNHLEGNSLNYGETKALILFGITAQGKPLKDHFEITGHDEAIKWITEVVKQERPLTESFIREIHQLLLKESYEKDSISAEGIPTKRRIEVGKYKTSPNHVLTKTGEIFYFANPEETPARMNDLMDWYKKENEEKMLNAISFAAKFHYDFIRIHPFDDGNGRTARILMNFILMQNGFPPVIIKTEDKENYFSVLRLADAGQLEPFIEYIAHNLNRSLEIMIKGAKGENVEEPEDLDKELALLEQRLKWLGDIDKQKVADLILIAIETSLNPLAQEFFKECAKFNMFYESTAQLIMTDNETIALKNFEAINLSTQVIHSESYSKTLRLNCDFSSFKNSLVGNFGYTSSIVIRFGFIDYSIETKNNGTIYTKGYFDYLSPEEIKGIVKKETDAHKTFIEYHIKASENKK